MRQAELSGSFPEQWSVFVGDLAAQDPRNRTADSLDACPPQGVDETQVELARAVAGELRSPRFGGTLAVLVTLVLTHLPLSLVVGCWQVAPSLLP